MSFPIVTCVHAAPRRFRCWAGQLVSYVDHGGAGPVVVLLHSFLMDVTMWAPQAEAFGRDYRLIAIDERGHGATPATGPFDHWDVAGEALAVLGTSGEPEDEQIDAAYNQLTEVWTAPGRSPRPCSCRTARPISPIPSRRPTRCPKPSRSSRSRVARTPEPHPRRPREPAPGAVPQRTPLTAHALAVSSIGPCCGRRERSSSRISARCSAGRVAA